MSVSMPTSSCSAEGKRAQTVRPRLRRRSLFVLDWRPILCARAFALYFQLLWLLTPSFAVDFDLASLWVDCYPLSTVKITHRLTSRFRSWDHYSVCARLVIYPLMASRHSFGREAQPKIVRPGLFLISYGVAPWDVLAVQYESTISRFIGGVVVYVFLIFPHPFRLFSVPS